MIDFMSQHPVWTFFAGFWAGVVFFAVLALWAVSKIASVVPRGKP